MMSKDGKSSIAHFVCFSNGIRIKEKPEYDFNTTRIPLNQIEKKVRDDLPGMDEGYIQAFIADVKAQFKN